MIFKSPTKQTDFLYMKLNPLFSDGAVFQRRMPIPVFGVTDPDSKIEIIFSGVHAHGIAGADGSFLVRLPACEAGGPYTLSVRNTRTGDAAEVRDILVGEVWLASGQSNMQFQLDASPDQLAELQADTAGSDTLRMFTVPLRASSAPEYTFSGGKWVCATAENLPKMNAVGTWFAKKLRDTLKVPVGIVSSSWGGTFIEAWTSRNTLRNNPDLTPYIDAYDAQLPVSKIWDSFPDDNPMDNPAAVEECLLFPKFCKTNPPDEGSKLGWADLDFDDTKWEKFSIPDSWMANRKGGNGVAWIRKAVTLPAHWAGRDLELTLGGIDKQDTTFFNGECVGATGQGYETRFWSAKRHYRVPGRLVKAGANQVAVRAFSFIYDGAFLGDAQDYTLKLAGTDESICFAGECAFRMEVDFGEVSLSQNTPYAMGPHHANTFSILFDSMIRPLIPYAIRGAIWYQGETNAKSVTLSRQYARKMADLIRDWRFWWEQGDFPFIQVCLAAYQGKADYEADCTWGPLRDSQRRAMRATVNSGLASAVDVGSTNNIHPLDKRTVGWRLAAWALEHTYCLPGVFGTGPEVRSAERVCASAVRLTFDDCAAGLVVKNGKLAQFYASDENGDYQAADAVLDGNTVLVSRPDGKTIFAVRYAWSQHPTLTLYNSAGLPATPFEIPVGK